ncbi:hypothetical protein ABQ039_011905 [Xanthomonas sp. WHRI 6108]
MMKTRKHPPGRKLGGRWRFHKAALDAYLSGEPWQEALHPRPTRQEKHLVRPLHRPKRTARISKHWDCRPDACNRVGVKAPRRNVPNEPPRRETTAPMGRSSAALAGRQTGQAQPRQRPA